MRPLVLALLALALIPAAADARLAFVCNISDICLADDDGGNPEPITTDGTKGGNYGKPTFSADGTQLSFDANAGTYLYTLATGKRVLIAGDDASFSALSPNGTLLATSEQRLNSDSGFHPQVCVYSTATPLAANCEGADAPFAPGLAYGPDNRLYTSVSNVTDTICRRAATGPACEATVVTDAAHRLRDLAVSPDGAHVAVNWASADQRRVRGPIAVYNLKTGALERQLTDGSDYAPVWTPDGKRIVFSRGVSLDDSALYTIPAAGKAGDEKLLVPEAREATFGAGRAGDTTGIDGFSAKADGHAVAVKLIVPTAGVTIHATFADALGQAYVKQHVVAGKRSFAVSLSKQGRKKLKHHGSLKVKLTVSLKPGGSETKTLTLKQ